jgi:hypothetical protein
MSRRSSTGSPFRRKSLSLSAVGWGLYQAVLHAEERRWWLVLLPLLDVEAPPGLQAETFRREVKDRLDVAGIAVQAPELARILLQAGGGEGVRHDTSTGGPLAALEMIGVDLAEFHRRLQKVGDSGLSIEVVAHRSAVVPR